MKRVVIAGVTALAIVGCHERSQHLPSPTPAPEATSLWAMVVEPGGVCIQGAKVVVVGGPSDGQVVTQNLPCDAWDHGGITVDSLIVGTEVTLRASAAGYATQEFKVTPNPTSWQRVFLMVLTEQ